jgi:hypothetical protein
MSKPEISITNSQARPPIPPSSKSSLSRPPQNQEPTYLSRYVEELPEERLHKSKSRSIKMNQSAKDEKLETTVRVNENLVTVKEEKVLLNSTVSGGQVRGFDDPEFQEKNFKKFSITALIKEKDLIKESNYFDESHLGDTELRPVVEKSRADFRIGEMENFETFQVKTFLFDRNLTQKIDQ